MSAIIRYLLRVGLVSKRTDGSIAWPFAVPSRWIWQHGFIQGVRLLCISHGLKPYVFRNLPGVVKWVPGRLLPRRWGFGWLGFEFGDRGH